mmetsp:Transcript_2720/g.3854  ORF Transcript_2720/g.3854 Transcript_2720/m.3854 type:complete len:260 (+) Transcript_2720:355-1134(+)
MSELKEQELSTVRVMLCGLGLILWGALGFHAIDNMMDESLLDPEITSRWINCVYCSIMTLTTVGFGDICPSTKINHVGQLFVMTLALAGLGMFCGPILTMTSNWKHQIPGGLPVLATTTLALGVVLFTYTEGMTELEAIYLSIITSTTIGYGDLTPQTDAGKLATALYALLAINVAGAFLQPAQDFLMNLCSRDITLDEKEYMAGAEKEKQEEKEKQKKEKIVANISSSSSSSTTAGTKIKAPIALQPKSTTSVKTKTT